MPAARRRYPATDACEFGDLPKKQAGVAGFAAAGAVLMPPVRSDVGAGAAIV
jgi:hypothetical protein